MNNDALYDRVQKALAAFRVRQFKSPGWAGAGVVIYGAGGFGRDLATILLRQNVEVIGFLDQKGTGQEITCGLRACNLGSVEAQEWLKKNPAVLIGAFNSSASMREITRTLTGVGFSTVVLPMEFYPYLQKELGWRYWLGTPDDYLAADDAIAQVRSLWADAESERLFLETLLFRLEGDFECVTTISGVSCQYAEPTLPRWKQPLRMIDGGAYNGDTLQSLLANGYSFEAIYAFEPDSGNFNKLRDAIWELPGSPQISLWPCGVGSSTGRLRFAEGGGTSAQFSETGTSQVPVVSLDDVLHGHHVNLIKLDIEGAEPNALKGAQKLIEKYRPGLAVCLYHFPQHLWSIPLWINDLNLGYRLFYRTHHHNSFESVLYAFPGEV